MKQFLNRFSSKLKRIETMAPDGKLTFWGRVVALYEKVTYWFYVIRIVSIPIFATVYASGRFSLVGYHIDQSDTLPFVVGLVLLSFNREIFQFLFGDKFVDYLWLPILVVRFLATFTIGTFLLFLPKLWFSFHYFVDQVTLGLGFALVIQWTREDFQLRLTQILENRSINPERVPLKVREELIDNAHSMSELDHKVLQFLKMTDKVYQQPKLFTIMDFIFGHPLTFTSIGLATVGALYGANKVVSAMDAKRWAGLYYVASSKEVEITREEMSRLKDLLTDTDKAGGPHSLVVRREVAPVEELKSIFPPELPGNRDMDYSRWEIVPGTDKVRVFSNICDRQVLYFRDSHPLIQPMRFEVGRTSASKEHALPKDVLASRSFAYTYYVGEEGNEEVLVRRELSRVIPGTDNRVAPLEVDDLKDLDSYSATRWASIRLRSLFPKEGKLVRKETYTDKLEAECGFQLVGPKPDFSVGSKFGERDLQASIYRVGDNLPRIEPEPRPAPPSYHVIFCRDSQTGELVIKSANGRILFDRDTSLFVKDYGKIAGILPPEYRRLLSHLSGPKHPPRSSGTDGTGAALPPKSLLDIIQDLL